MSATGQTLEILTGAKAIGRFLGLSTRQVFHRVEDGTLPTFRMGKNICARPSTLLAWIAEQEAETDR